VVLGLVVFDAVKEAARWHFQAVHHLKGVSIELDNLGEAAPYSS